MSTQIQQDSTAVPAPQAVTQLYTISGGAAITAKTFTAGETTTVPGKMNQNAIMGDLAFRYLISGACILNGLGLSADDNSLSVTVAAGHALLHSLLELAADTSVAVNANATSYIWITPSRVLTALTGSAGPPDTGGVFLGTVVTDASRVTSVDLSGVVYLRNGVLYRETADAGVPADTPPDSMMLFTRTASGLFLWDGTAYRSLPDQTVIKDSGGNKVGFYGASPVVRQTVTLTSPSTVSATYTQSEVQHLRDDLAALRTALNAYGLV